MPSSSFNTKNIVMIGTFIFSIVSSTTILGIASYKILTHTEQSELWTGMMTFLVGLYIPSPMSSYTKFSTTGNSVVQQNIQPSQDEV
jgi:hypothetical protein